MIQQSVVGKDAGGGSTGPTWVTFAKARAAIDPVRGSERLRAMQIEDTVTHRITIRYRAGITAKMRVKFGTRVMNIRAVLNWKEENRWLDIMAEEGVAT